MLFKNLQLCAKAAEKQKGQWPAQPAQNVYTGFRVCPGLTSENPARYNQKTHQHTLDKKEPIKATDAEQSLKQEGSVTRLSLVLP